MTSTARNDKSSDLVQSVASKPIDKYEPPLYSYKESFSDWLKHAWKYSNQDAEYNLLSSLPFFPESDGKRVAKIIDTDIGGGNFIHELYIENIEQPSSAITHSDTTRDVVLIHGYGAALGLFIENYDLLSSVPGIRIHAIDLLGFGLSSRPSFPKLPCSTKDEVLKVEDWFIDPIEEWRKKRNLSRFNLIGHSFGGYLSCAYALKYNKKIKDDCTGEIRNLVNKLVLISPAGVPRNKYSLLKDVSNQAAIPEAKREAENKQIATNNYSREFEDNQEDIVHNRPTDQSSDPEFLKNPSFRVKVILYLWNRHFSPLSLMRNSGPLKSRILSRWTTNKLAHVYAKDPEQFRRMHSYLYRILNAKGSGEYAITRVLEVGASPRLPLLDRCPARFVAMGLPSLWLYGDKDWMDKKAGFEMEEEINKLSQKTYSKDLAECSIISRSGHHLYLDNPNSLIKEVYKFLGYT
ncbi:uncharacterized protein PRCAT00001755001 [Priceomyces carsonii]|uniref:uncharacterized protein n=1 Tax=Priceomyces carsonii TaxID=28549 RepID=UPI002ED90355|nr:unnamed protein product [Priceomyces carsonii]